MANENFSQLTAISAIGAGDQILIRLNNALSGSAGFARVDVAAVKRRITTTLPTISATGTIASNALSADQFVVSLSGIALSATIGAPSNPYDAQIIMWNIRYTTNIARVLLDSSFRTPITTLNWSISANRMDIMAAKYNLLDSKWDIISFAPGYII